MPTRLEEVQDLYAFNRWANRRMLDAAAALDAEAYARALVSSFPSIRDTLVHMLSADWVWLRRWKGTSPDGMPEGWQGMPFDRLLDAWAALEAEQGHFVAGLSEEDLDVPLAYRNTKGEAYAQPLRELLRHVVNHASYHRGQLVTLLRQVGAEPPATDMVIWHRERRDARARG
jgi:uncharacterized damage-inducible protein DinB